MTSNTDTQPNPASSPKPTDDTGAGATATEHPVDTKVQEDAAKERAESGGYD